MATQRSRRLRKKMHIGEFQESGFTVGFAFPEGRSSETIDTTVDALLEEAVDPNGLAFVGSGYSQWEGLICLQQTGKCTDEHRELLRKWLEARGLKDIQVSELFDIWWD